MDEKICVVSTVNGNIGITVPQLNFRKEWARKGAKVLLKKEILEEALYDPGVEYMFNNGMLYIEDLEAKKILGLEPEDAKEPENIIVLNDKQMKRYLSVAPTKELKDILKKLSPEQRKNLVDFAIENNITDIERCNILEEATGINVLNAIILKRKQEED